MKWSDFLEATATHGRRQVLDLISRAKNEETRRSAATAAEDSPIAITPLQNQGLARLLAQMEAPYESWKSGQNHQTDEAFERIWAGESLGFSRQHVTERLSSQRSIIDDLQTGFREPHDIVGATVYGSTTAEIIDNLRLSIEIFEEALLCAGRNLSVNQTRVMQMVRSGRR